MTLPDYEKLGAFYLGREVDAQTGTDAPELVLYDSRDLTTHAVCVGMTAAAKPVCACPCSKKLRSTACPRS